MSETALATHPAELRTRPRDVQRAPKPEPRKCACGRPISALRASDKCHTCDEAEAAAELAAEIAKTKAREAAEAARERGKRMTVKGITFIPEEIPGRNGGKSASRWEEVCRAFLASGHNSVRLEIGSTKAKTAYTNLRLAVRRCGLLSECYPAQRGDAVYLARVKPIGGAS